MGAINFNCSSLLTLIHKCFYVIGFFVICIIEVFLDYC